MKDILAMLIAIIIAGIIIVTVISIGREDGDWYHQGIVDAYNGTISVSVIAPDIYKIDRPFMQNDTAIVIYDYANDNSTYTIIEKE